MLVDETIRAMSSSPASLRRVLVFDDPSFMTAWRMLPEEAWEHFSAVGMCDPCVWKSFLPEDTVDLGKAIVDFVVDLCQPLKKIEGKQWASPWCYVLLCVKGPAEVCEQRCGTLRQHHDLRRGPAAEGSAEEQHGALPQAAPGRTQAASGRSLQPPPTRVGAEENLAPGRSGEHHREGGCRVEGSGFMEPAGCRPHPRDGVALCLHSGKLLQARCCREHRVTTLQKYLRLRRRFCGYLEAHDEGPLFRSLDVFPSHAQDQASHNAAKLRFKDFGRVLKFMERSGQQTKSSSSTLGQC